MYLFGLLVGGGVREELPEKRSVNMKKVKKGLKQEKSYIRFLWRKFSDQRKMLGS